MDMKYEIEKRRKDAWIESWWAIEALAVDKDFVEKSLKDHIESLEKSQNIFVYEKTFKDAVEVQKPFPDIPNAWSQVVEVKLFSKDLLTFLNTVFTYGPSAIEILGPNRKEIALDEVQNIANILAGLVHQFAAAGVGGVVISPKK